MTGRRLPIGRDDVFASLNERYRKAVCADGGAIFLCGEPGIGKTRILESFVESFLASDRNVFVTTALDYASSPFAPIARVVETWLQTRPQLFDYHPGLREAVTGLLAADSRGDAPSAGERRRCFESVARLFRLAAADEPTTLVIDDLHNADIATMHLLHTILTATTGSAFLLIAAYRSGAIAREPAAEIARLQRLDNVTRLDIGPIAPAAFDEVVRSIGDGKIGRDAHARIVERAEGNPLFARELVRQSLGSVGMRASVPDSVAHSVLERMAEFDECDRRMLAVAAAIGRTFKTELLGRAAARDEAQVFQTLRAAARAGLVAETADPEVFAFHHGLTQEAIYRDVFEAERRAIHLRIFTALNASPQSSGSVASLAYHAHAAGEREAATFYCELAGDQAAAGQAFEAAVEHYERALSAGDTATFDGARIAQKLAVACVVVGLPERAIESAAVALNFHRAHSNLAGVVEMSLLLANVAGQVGEDEARLEWLAQVRTLLTDTLDPVLLAKRSLCESEISLSERNVQGVIDACALGLIDRSIEPSVAIALRNAHAHALLMQYRYREAVVAQALAVRYAFKNGTSEQLSSSRFSLGAVLALSGEIGRASMAFRRAANVAAGRWATSERAMSLAMAGEMELMSGNVAGAASFLHDALPDARRSDHPGVVVALGRVGLFLGLRTADFKLLRNVVATLDLETLFRERTPAQYFPLSGAFAQYLVSVGRPDEATEILKRAVRRLSVKRLRSTDWSVCSMLTVADLGDPADAAAARRPLAEWFAPYAPAFVHLFDAIVAARAGDTKLMSDCGEAAIVDFRRFGFAFEEGVCLEFAGRKAEALGVMEAAGFVADAARLREELTPRNRRGRAASALTNREREVAALVTKHLTNRQIADLLFVSEKTVETHLASVFTKLAVQTRSDVAEKLEGDAPAIAPRPS